MFNIYMITNLINKKLYIGITRHPLKKRWREHLSASKTGSNYKLHKAIRKYGKENFTIELIENVSDDKTLLEKEMYYIEKHDTVKQGYNNTLGGEGTHYITLETLIDYKNTFLKTKSLLETANKYNLSSAMMSVHLQRLGVDSGMFINKVTDDELEFALHYLNNGFLLKEISKKLKRNPVLLSKKIKDKYKINPKELVNKVKNEKIKEGINLLKTTDLEVSDISKLINMPYGTFYGHLIKNGIKPKRKHKLERNKENGRFLSR